MSENIITIKDQRTEIIQRNSQKQINETPLKNTSLYPTPRNTRLNDT